MGIHCETFHDHFDYLQGKVKDARSFNSLSFIVIFFVDLCKQVVNFAILA